MLLKETNRQDARKAKSGSELAGTHVISSWRSLRLGGFLLVALLAMFAATLRAADTDTPADTMALLGKPAPELSMPTLDDQHVKLSEQKGKVVVIDFWATWCIPCREVLPHLQKLHDDPALKEKGLVIWAVDAISKNETKPKVQKYIEQNKYTFTVPLDVDEKARKAYVVVPYPTTVVVGRDGIVKAVFPGYENEEDIKKLDEAILKALAEPAP